MTASVHRTLYCEAGEVEKQDQHLYGGWSRHDPDRTTEGHQAQYPSEGEPDTHSELLCSSDMREALKTSFQNSKVLISNKTVALCEELHQPVLLGLLKQYLIY